MTHHVCSGSCGGSSDAPGTCSAEGCTNKGGELTACDCEEGAAAHGGQSVDASEEAAPEAAAPEAAAAEAAAPEEVAPEASEAPAEEGEAEV